MSWKRRKLQPVDWEAIQAKHEAEQEAAFQLLCKTMTDKVSDVRCGDCGQYNSEHAAKCFWVELRSGQRVLVEKRPHHRGARSIAVLAGGEGLAGWNPDNAEAGQMVIADTDVA